MENQNNTEETYLLPTEQTPPASNNVNLITNNPNMWLVITIATALISGISIVFGVLMNNMKDQMSNMKEQLVDVRKDRDRWEKRYDKKNAQLEGYLLDKAGIKPLTTEEKHEIVKDTIND